MNELQLLSELLDLPDTQVKSYQMKGANQIELKIETSLEAAVCPACGEVSETRHEIGDEQPIRDLPMWNRRCLLRYRPRRFKCQRCQDTFVEPVLWRSGGMSYTLRYEQHLYQRARREPHAQIARDEGVSEDTVQAIFVRWAKKRSTSAGIQR
jgi:transposase